MIFTTKTQRSHTEIQEKSAAVFAVRRANYTHRRKGVFNARSIVHLNVSGNVRFRTHRAPKTIVKNVKHLLFASVDGELNQKDNTGSFTPSCRLAMRVV